MDAAVRRTLVLALGGAVLVLLGAGLLVHGPPGAGGGTTADSGATFVEPVADGGTVWPYTSRASRFATRTLPLNVIVRGDHDVVRREFLRSVGANWTATNASADERADAALAVEDGDVVWFPAHGARRHTYFGDEDAGIWVAEDYQLYDGSYLGVRHHLRAFEAPAGAWTAMQGHAEYWDWFRLRHTVTSTAETRAAIEDQFADDARVTRVERVPLDNPGKRDGEGLATLVEFAALATILALAGGPGARERRSGVATRLRELSVPARPARVAGLAVVVFGIYLGVRAGGILLETWLRGVHPQVVAAGLYPVLAIGLPGGAYVAARGLRAEAAFLAACAGLALALVAEYAFLGLAVVPVELLAHRVAVVLAVGLVAAAGALSTSEPDDWLDVLAIGVGGWVVALGLALFGLL